jgi:hypothetical protein
MVLSAQPAMRHHEHTTLRRNDATESALEAAATTVLHQDFDGACQISAIPKVGSHDCLCRCGGMVAELKWLWRPAHKAL